MPRALVALFASPRSFRSFHPLACGGVAALTFLIPATLSSIELEHARQTKTYSVLPPLTEALFPTSSPFHETLRIQLFASREIFLPAASLTPSCPRRSNRRLKQVFYSGSTLARPTPSIHLFKLARTRFLTTKPNFFLSLAPSRNSIPIHSDRPSLLFRMPCPFVKHGLNMPQ